MANTIEDVEFKVKETDFFLGKMIEAGSESFEFSCYLSAFLSSSRSITYALQHLNWISGFSDWYKNHQDTLKKNPIAKLMHNKRNAHIHGGPTPVSSAWFFQEKAQYWFKEREELGIEDIISSSRKYFINLLEIVLDCYKVLGIHFDPQQIYTREHFNSIERTIDDAEVEIWGWIMDSYIDEGYEEDDRWFDLRSRVGECSINHLFKGYLGVVTPQPLLPDYLMECEFSEEEKGWNYIPHGFGSIEEYHLSLNKNKVG